MCPAYVRQHIYMLFIYYILGALATLVFSIHKYKIHKVNTSSRPCARSSTSRQL